MRSARGKYFSLILLIIAFIVGMGIATKQDGVVIEIASKDFKGLRLDLAVFAGLLVNNTLVGIFLSIGGYFTAGIMTILVLFWNGLSLGLIISQQSQTNLNFFEFSKYFIYHGIFEFYAFILFANIGYSGIEFYKNLFKNNEVITRLNYRQFLLPQTILTMAALIEATLISTY